MFSRRQFLENGLKGSAVVSLSGAVPHCVGAAARAAETKESDRIVVVVQLSGGNDGLNTVIPYGDDLYQKARPTLRFPEKEVIRIDDHIGLNPSLKPCQGFLKEGQLAIVQGVGYPNPNRSRFSSMDIWHGAGRGTARSSGWLGRGISSMKISDASIPAFHIGESDLPLALQNGSVAVPTFHRDRPFDLQLSGNPDGSNSSESRKTWEKSRESLIKELTIVTNDSSDDLLQFVTETSSTAYETVDELRKIVQENQEQQNILRY